MPNIHRFSLALFVGAILIASPALAAPAADGAAKTTVDPRAEPLVRRYLAAVRIERTMDSMQAAMLPVLSDQLSHSTTELSADDRQAIMEIVRKAMREKMMPRLVERFVPIYASTFTVSELEALVAFYESPTGRSITDKLPSLAPKSAEITRELMPVVMADVMKEIVERFCPGGKCPPDRVKPTAS